jgi:hypothetical protein
LFLSYYFFIHVPIGIAAICVPLILATGWSWWIGFAFAVGLYVIVLLAGAVGARLGNKSKAEREAKAKVPKPQQCDLCHEIDPGTCPRPWKFASCVLRSVETGQTYLDFMPKPWAKPRSTA